MIESLDLSAMSWSAGLGTVVSLCLFGMGFAGLLTQRRVLKQLFALKVMLQGVCLSLIIAGVLNDDLPQAQSIVVSALVVEAVLMAVALALVVNVYRHYPSGDVDDLNRLKG